MIPVKEKLGNIHTAVNHKRYIDVLPIEWHEARKRILHKKTKQGIAVILKFLNENPNLKDGDILYENENTIIVVEINPCECIVITPENIRNAASVCYEIGNRHLPLFYEEDELLVPYDVPLHNILQLLGYKTRVETRKLNESFKTTVLPYLQVGITDSLSNKISQLTTIS